MPRVHCSMNFLCWNFRWSVKQGFTLKVKDWHWILYFFATSTELCGWWVESGKKRSKLSWEDSIIVERTQLEQTPFNEDGAVSETLVKGWKQRCVIIKVIPSSELWFAKSIKTWEGLVWALTRRWIRRQHLSLPGFWIRFWGFGAISDALLANISTLLLHHKNTPAEQK